MGSIYIGELKLEVRERRQGSGSALLSARNLSHWRPVGADSRRRLESMLSETLESCQRRESCAFDESAGANPKLILFGGGGLGRKVLSALRSDGVEPVAFADNKLAGSVVDGLPVLHPGEAGNRWGSSGVFVITIWASWADTLREQVESLRSHGCRRIVTFIPLLWKYPRLLPHVQVDLPSHVLEQRDSVLKAFELLSDSQSQEDFAAQIRWRLYGDFSELPAPSPNQYWQQDLIDLTRAASFADAGAFDGDTLAAFVSKVGSRFRHADLFEPDPANVASIEQRLLGFPAEIRNGVRIHPFAVADAAGTISFRAGAGASSAAGEGGISVPTVALDDVLLEPPDYIKYDIEGFELLALQGTRRIIAEHAPPLAVCTYHVQSHLWEVPLLIHSLNPRYRLYQRSHGQIWETVCYARPDA
ncbi:MAG: FkbM family methyltransferase [Acidobacteriaceae bacterium]